jgi:hypothetical protein
MPEKSAVNIPINNKIHPPSFWREADMVASDLYAEH